MSGHDATFDVARFYTRSRRFPRMVGRLPEGTKIWGGPYSFTQLGIGLATAAVLIATRGVWGLGSIVLDLALIAAGSWGAAFAGRLIPLSNVSPVVLAATAFGAVAAPRYGTFNGRPWTPARPRAVGRPGPRRHSTAPGERR